ncbi:MAG: RHS repeat-associated core domain-containing protein [Acidobacteriota bacterium]
MSKVRTAVLKATAIFTLFMFLCGNMLISGVPIAVAEDTVATEPQAPAVGETTSTDNPLVAESVYNSSISINQPQVTTNNLTSTQSTTITNNTYGTAIEIQPGEITETGIKAAGETPWFKITINTPCSIISKVYNNSGYIRYYLCDSNLTRLSYATVSNGATGQMGWKVQPGQYYIQICENLPINYNISYITVKYDLRAQDQYENNDTAQTATLLEEGQQLSGIAIEAANDSDWFQINVDHTCSIITDAFSSGGVRVYLLNSAQTPLTNMLLNGGGRKLGWKVPPGQYYLKIVEYGTNNYFSSNLTLKYNLCEQDLYETNDVSTTAYQISPSKNYSGITIEAANDHDWFKINVLNPCTLVTTVYNNSGSLSYSLCDSNQKTLKSGNMTGTVLTLVYDVTPGLYYIHICEYNIGVNYLISSISLKVSPSYYVGSISGKNGKDTYCVYFDPETHEYSFVLEPVDAASGAHYIQKSLLTVNGAQPLSLSTQYNSLLLKEGPMGKGWGHNYETRLESLANNDVKIHWSANSVSYYVYANGTYSSQDPRKVYDKLAKNPDGTYTLTLQDLSVYQFNAAGQLTRQISRNSQPLDYTYDSSGRLANLTEPTSGKSFAFTYNANNLLDKVTDNAGRSVSFTYDTAHNLTAITSPGGKTTTFTYDANGQVLTETDPEGRLMFSNTYDEQGRVIAQDDGNPNNQIARMSYDETSQPGYLITTVTDRNGRFRILTHNDKYQLISEIDELGKTTTYTYDAAGNRNGVTNVAGSTTTLEFDSRGNVVKTTDAYGCQTTMTYDERNNLLTVTNTAGKSISTTYNSRNNPLTITDPLGRTTHFTYNEQGQLLTNTNPCGGTTTNTYENGVLKTFTDPTGIKSTFYYDAAGRVTSITNNLGKTASMTYDADDYLISTTDPLGHTVSLTYDGSGNKLTSTDAEGNTTQYQYNSQSMLVKTIDPLGNETNYEYDGEDRLNRVIDAKGNTTILTYDPKGRLITTTNALGYIVGMQYDDVDNVTGQTDALGIKVISSTYDKLGNPLTIKDALGNTVANQYDDRYRLVKVTDSLGSATSFGYDDLNRLISTTDSMSGLSSQVFDEEGNLKSFNDANTNLTVYNYDAAGRVISTNNAAGTVHTFEYNQLGLLSKSINGRGQETTYHYDDIGRMVQQTDDLGSISYTFDANGNVLTITDASGTITREYDALNRVTRYTDNNGNIIQYQYDQLGNLTTLTYPDGKQVHYEYDACSQLNKVTDWASRVTTYGYDPNGRLTSTTRPDGSVENRTYNAVGQLTQLKDSGRDNKVIIQFNYTYDAAGNITAEQKDTPHQSFTAADQTMTYTVDNRMATSNGQAVQYDADGNMTSVSLNGQKANLTFDCRNRLTSTGDTSYTYDAQDNRISVTSGVYQNSYVINPSLLSQVLINTASDGNKTYYVYGLGLLGQENPDGSYQTYHFDLRGSTVAITDQAGVVTDRYQYAPFGELVYHQGNTATPFLFNGRDGVMSDGNGLYYLRARYYHPELGRFLSRDMLIGQVKNPGTLNLFAYCNDDPINGIDPNGYEGKSVLDYIVAGWGWFTDLFKAEKATKSVNENYSSCKNYYQNHIENLINIGAIVDTARTKGIAMSSKEILAKVKIKPIPGYTDNQSQFDAYVTNCLIGYSDMAYYNKCLKAVGVPYDKLDIKTKRLLAENFNSMDTSGISLEISIKYGSKMVTGAIEALYK